MIYIDYRDKRPIYEQIIEQVERMVTSGALQPDEQLPSVRKLAMDLAINPNTISRAYALLEQRGVIYSRQGRGNFISGNVSALQDERRRLLREKAASLLEEAEAEGIDLREVLNALQEERQKGGLQA